MPKSHTQIACSVTVQTCTVSNYQLSGVFSIDSRPRLILGNQVLRSFSKSPFRLALVLAVITCDLGRTWMCVVCVLLELGW